MHLPRSLSRLAMPLLTALCLPALAEPPEAPAEEPARPVQSSPPPAATEPTRLVAPVTAPSTSDPWTSKRVVLLGERMSYRVAVLPGDVLGDLMGSLPGPVAGLLGGLVGERFPGVLGDATAEVTTNGGRLELGNWGFSFGVGTGSLVSGGLGGAVGGQARLPLSTMTGAISVSLGAWAPLDIGSVRLRVGIAWPELHLRFTRAIVQSPDGETTWMALQLGGSALGLRVTLGELLFLEARLGEANVEVAYLMRGGARALQRGYGFDLLPTFRAGLSF